MEKTRYSPRLYRGAAFLILIARRLLLRSDGNSKHLFTDFTFGFRPDKILSQSDGWIVRYERNKISAISTTGGGAEKLI